MSEQPQRVGEQVVDELDHDSSLSDFEKELDGIVEARQAGMRRNRQRTSPQDSPGDELEHLGDTNMPEDQEGSPEETEQETPGQEGSDEPDEPVSPVEPAQVEPPAPFTYTYNDQQFDEAAIKDALEVRAWRDTLTPQASQAINALLTGSHVLVERSEYERIQKGESVKPTIGTPAATEQPELTDDDLAELPPAVAATIRAQQQAIQQLTKSQQDFQQSQQVQQQTQFQQQLSKAITDGAAAIKSKYDLTEEEYKQVDAAAVRYAPSLIADLGPEKGVLEALDTAYLRVFNSRELARQIAAQQTANQQQQESKQQTTNRKRNAGSVGKGSSGSGPTPTPSKASKRDSLVQDVEALLNANN